MEILFFLILYIIIGIIRVLRESVNRDIASAYYVRHPNILMSLIIILLWPLFIIQRLIEQRRRMNFKFIFDFYLIPLFWGSWAYIASMVGFSTILTSDSVLYVKIFKIVGILIVFSAIIWWLLSRNRRKIREYIDKA